MILIDALQQSVKDAAALNNRGHDYRLSAVQVLTGPPRSGKTVQAAAYATALYGAGLIQQDALDITCCANITDLNDLTRIIIAAKGKLLAIDEFEKLPPNKEMGNLLAQVAVAGDCLLVFTGAATGLAELQRHHPRLYELLPAPLELKTVYPRDPALNAAFNAARDSEKAQAVKDRAEVMERRRLSEIWQAMDKVDVSLPTAITPVKTVRFRQKVQP